VARGCSFLDTAEDCRSARRFSSYPELREIVFGFRITCELAK
jgi:formylglycine-generating enzyme required for sulfatase activity